MNPELDRTHKIRSWWDEGGRNGTFNSLTVQVPIYLSTYLSIYLYLFIYLSVGPEGRRRGRSRLLPCQGSGRGQAGEPGDELRQVSYPKYLVELLKVPGAVT